MRALTLFIFLLAVPTCWASDASVSKLTRLLLPDDLLEARWRDEWRTNIKIMISAGLLADEPKVTYEDYAKRTRLTTEDCRNSVSKIIEREFSEAERERLIAILDSLEGKRLLEIVWNPEKLRSKDGMTLGERVYDFSSKKRFEMKSFIEGRL